MKKYNAVFLICCFLLSIHTKIFAQNNSSSAIDPKTKAFLIICGYGTVGGGLLGLASLAFGAKSRAIAQGASLGLYAGIIFGAIVLGSHPTSAEESLSSPDNLSPFDAPGGYSPFDPNASETILRMRGVDQHSIQELPPLMAVNWSWNF